MLLTSSAFATSESFVTEIALLDSESWACMSPADTRIDEIVGIHPEPRVWDALRCVLRPDLHCSSAGIPDHRAHEPGLSRSTGEREKVRRTYFAGQIVLRRRDMAPNGTTECERKNKNRQKRRPCLIHCSPVGSTFKVAVRPNITQSAEWRLGAVGVRSWLAERAVGRPLQRR